MNDRTALAAVIEAVFRTPVITTPALKLAAHVSQPTAHALRRAEEHAWLRSAGRWGRGGKERWVADEVCDVLTEGESFEDNTR